MRSSESLNNLVLAAVAAAVLTIASCAPQPAHAASNEAEAAVVCLVKAGAAAAFLDAREEVVTDSDGAFYDRAVASVVKSSPEVGLIMARTEAGVALGVSNEQAMKMAVKLCIAEYGLGI